ncbi:CIC11C00000001786 [Sungouiella intermedia]|uniref:candidapepsin n=1 Tax=Sungouiella intermedia TaxID=45354 RepID=A0A1L0DEU7_9ASCO|nr:CIC11C00000001786 [[Candida] intermedia]
MNVSTCISILSLIQAITAIYTQGYPGKRTINPGSLKLDFKVDRESSRRSIIEQYGKRDEEVLVQLYKEELYYSLDIYVGSNRDKCNVMLDTGSSDLWVMSPDVYCAYSSSSYNKRAIGKDGSLAAIHRPNLPPHRRAFTEKKAQDKRAGATTCTKLGSFATSKSDSFKLNKTDSFSISYLDGTYAYGEWGHDQVLFGNHTLSSLSLAVVNLTDSYFGVLGVGPAGSETSTRGGKSYEYENFPMRLKSEGVINKNAYSLFLNSVEEKTGSVLFGAVDHSKYSGTLQKVPIINSYPEYFDEPAYVNIVLNDIKVENSNVATSLGKVSVSCLMDSGFTNTYLPALLLEPLMEQIGATYSYTAEAYYLDCDKFDDISLTFDFSGVEIRAPLSDFIFKYKGQCYVLLFEMQDTYESDAYAVMGDTFLRNAYVVYDLDDLEILLAQANYSKNEDIEVIQDSVPLAVQAAGYSQTSIHTTIGRPSTTTLLGSSPLQRTSQRSAGSQSDSAQSTTTAALTGSPNPDKGSSASKTGIPMTALCLVVFSLLMLM